MREKRCEVPFFLSEKEGGEMGVRRGGAIRAEKRNAESRRPKKGTSPFS